MTVVTHSHIYLLLALILSEQDVQVRQSAERVGVQGCTYHTLQYVRVWDVCVCTDNSHISVST